jgi:error-prone DNA polymerase
MAGVVRIHTEAIKAGLRPVIGCRLRLVSGDEFLAYPKDRDAYGRLCTLLTKGKRHDAEKRWQAKGVCDITLSDLSAHCDGIQLIVIPDSTLPRAWPIWSAAYPAYSISL